MWHFTTAAEWIRVASAFSSTMPIYPASQAMCPTCTPGLRERAVTWSDSANLFLMGGNNPISGVCAFIYLLFSSPGFILFATTRLLCQICAFVFFFTLGKV